VSQPDEGAWCVACGGHINPATDKTFALSPERDLCFVCSIERGGQYDEQTDRWIVPPLDPAIALHDARA
jgi:hypothetical protein